MLRLMPIYQLSWENAGRHQRIPSGASQLFCVTPLWETLRLLVTSARANKGTPPYQHCQPVIAVLGQDYIVNRTRNVLLFLSTIRYLNGPLRRKLPLKAQSTSGSNCYSSDTTTRSTASTTSTAVLVLLLVGGFIFFIFHLPIWLICFKWVETTNQTIVPSRVHGPLGVTAWTHTFFTWCIQGESKDESMPPGLQKLLDRGCLKDVPRSFKHLMTDPWEWYIYRWCFQICFIFTPTWGDDPNLTNIFFKWIETTN